VSEQKLGGFKGGVPSATHVDHVGITVPNLDEAVIFFTEVLGCELVYEEGPVERKEGDWMKRQFNVHPQASFRLAMLRCGSVTNLELFEYSASDQRTELPKNSDYGGHHLGFFVTDIEAAIAYLREQQGVTVLGDLMENAEGPIKGNKAIYFLSPWGMQLEVRSWELGMPYERMTNVRMFGPESP
jgi:catechol 2,3-dioxygenase-like lactoylglutathione lyase family enzyme